MKTFMAALVLVLLPSLADAATYSCTNGQYVMSADVTLSGSDVVNLVGTATARCTWIGNNHRFIVSDASWTGSFAVKFVDIFDAGTSALDVLGGSLAGDYAYLNNGSLAFEDNTVNRSGGFNLYAAGTTTESWKRNDFSNTNLISVDYSESAEHSHYLIKESGTSSATKYFQSNKVYRSWVDLGSANWIIGAAAGCTSTCDSDGNVLIGKRAGIYARGANCYISYNYGRGNLEVSPSEPTWTQVALLGTVGDGCIVENNVIREAHWLVQQIGSSTGSTVRNNVVLQQEPHQLFRISVGGVIQGNIGGWRYPGINSFLSGSRPASGDSVGLLSPGNSWIFRNNTIDERGAAVKAIMWVGIGATLTSYRNNAVYGLSLLANGCNPGVDCTTAISRDQIAEGVGYSNGSPAARIGYADYNDTFFQTTSPRKVVYDLTVPAKSICGDDVGQHDLWAAPGCAPVGTSAGVDPQFLGTLPVGSGFDGGATTSDSGFPFADQDIVSGKYTVSTLLAYFRYVYAPGPTSPLLNAQDPADGAGNIGAVQTITPEPAVSSTNKAPVVSAGPSFTLNSAVSPGTCNSGTLPAMTCLAGIVADDAKPSGVLRQQWSLVRGPAGATATFANRALANTTVALSAQGVYVLRLTATDGALISHSDTTITVGCRGTGIPSGTTGINAIVQAQPTATTFCFAGVTYQPNAIIEAKTNDKFYGTTGTVLDGQNIRTVAFHGTGTLGGAHDVTISGLEVKNFTSEAIQTGWYWTVVGNNLHNNLTGVSLNSFSTLDGNWIHLNTQYGLVGGPGTDMLIVDNEIDHNNTGNFCSGTCVGDAGGSKIVGSTAGTTGLIWRRNYVHDNLGPGIWSDGNVRALYEDNTVDRNSEIGIFHELSWDATIRNNYLTDNGIEGAGQSIYHGSNIHLNDSSNVEIYGNVITASNGSNGIGIVAADRSDAVAPYPTGATNNYVHDNTVKMNGSATTGLVRDGSRSFSGTNFNGNHYFVTDDTGAWWIWPPLNSDTWAQWQAAGQDATGTLVEW